MTQLHWGQLQLGTKLGEVQAGVSASGQIGRREDAENGRAEQWSDGRPTRRAAERSSASRDVKQPLHGKRRRAKPAAAIPDGKISIDDFAKVELRVAQVKTAERVKGADKLLRLEVDLGTEVRQLVAGIAEAYEPETLIGRKVVIVANLAPRKLRGLESNGMIVAASPEGGKPVLASFLEDVPVGAQTEVEPRSLGWTCRGPAPLINESCSSIPTRISKASVTTPIVTRCSRARSRRDRGLSRHRQRRRPRHGRLRHRLAEKYSGKSEYPRIWASVGIHPHEASLANEAAYAQLAATGRGIRKVIAWGEIGLDYFYDHSPREIQKTVFVRQMELAAAAKLPIIIHCRPSDNSENAWDDCLALIAEHWAAHGLGGILHCFTGSVEHARRALDMGFMISFAGQYHISQGAERSAMRRDGSARSHAD